MKQLSFLVILFCTSLNLSAQEKIYTIDASGTVSPAIGTEKPESIKFVIDRAFKDKSVYILLDDNTTQVNKNFAVLNKDFLKDETGTYPIIIKKDRTIDKCTNCEQTVGDVFSIVLDDKKKGPFHLKAVSIENDDKKDDKNSNNDSDTYQYGSIINDALYIAKGGNTGKIVEILKTQYDITEDNKDKNFFLKASLSDDVYGSIQSTIDDKGKSVLSTFSSAVGGLDVTSLADGFAKFIVNRTKQELSIAFFKRFKEDITNNKDLNSAFPNTSTLLLAIDTQIYSYSNYINNLREAFRSDLKIIDENLPAVIENHNVFFDKPENIKLKVALLSAFYITTSLKQKVHPGDILNGYPISNFNDKGGVPYTELYPLRGSTQLVQLFSESLRETDVTQKKYWVDIDKVRLLVGNKKALQIYIGLLLQKAIKNYDYVKFNGTDNFYSIINTQTNATNFETDYQNYKEYILGVGNKIEGLNIMINDYEKTSTDSLKVELYSKYFKATVDLLQSSTDVSKLKYLNTITGLKDLKKNSKNYFDIAYEVADLTTAINRKNYPEIINHVIVIYDKVLVKPMSAEAKKIEVNVDSRKEKAALLDEIMAQNKIDPSKSIGTLIKENPKVLEATQIKEKDSAVNVFRCLVKYGAFMANMINAKTSDEVANTIESVALPVGSASIKRETTFNVSLNAYCGLFVGNEIIKDVDENKPFSRFNSFGVTAPIGISISRGDYLFFAIPAKGWSSSAFLSIVDLGAIAAYRFNDDKTEQVPTIELKDILSPGLFVSIGIPKTPISVNFGAQIGPNLRKVTDETNDYSDKLYTRYSMSVCVDIPLLNLYTKSRN